QVDGNCLGSAERAGQCCRPGLDRNPDVARCGQFARVLRADRQAHPDGALGRAAPPCRPDPLPCLARRRMGHRCDPAGRRGLSRRLNTDFYGVPLMTAILMESLPYSMPGIDARFMTPETVNHL